MSKISIIIPIYNAEKFLKKSLESLIHQTYQNIEIICINDGSNDDSLKILKEYKNNDKRIIIIDKENAGVSEARNDGIKKATGEFITFVDADDWIEPNAIELLYNTLIKENVDVVRGNFCINFDYDKNGPKGNYYNVANKKYCTSDTDFGNNVIDKIINGQIPCYVCLLLIKKEFLKDITFKKEIKLLEDTIFYHELMNKINNIYFLDLPLYHYYNNQASCTRSTDYYIRNMYNLIEVNKYINHILKNGKFYTDERIEMVNAIHINFIVNYFFEMYKVDLKNNNELIAEMNKLLNNKDFIDIYNNANLNNLALHLKISANLIFAKKYKTLFIFYGFRSLVSKFKDKLLKRK